MTLTGKDVTAANVKAELASLEANQETRRKEIRGAIAEQRSAALARINEPYQRERSILKLLLKKLELEGEK